MGQIEVFELLRKVRLCGDDRFFSVNEVEKLMKEDGYTNGSLASVRRSLLILENYDYLEIKMSGEWRDWKRLYRVKDKYVKKTGVV